MYVPIAKLWVYNFGGLDNRRRFMKIPFTRCRFFIESPNLFRVLPLFLN